MTLEEAIKHAEEKAEELRNEAEHYEIAGVNVYGCEECAKEQDQLAEWLRDYKRLKEQEPCDDTISRQDALRAFMYATNGERLPDYDCDNYPVTYDLRCIKKTLRALPSAQPEIIRCKDCKYWREHKYAKETKRYIPFCGFNAIYTKSDDFCSRAERRENDKR